MKVSVRYPHGDIKKTIRYSTLELRREFQMVFGDSQESMDREENQGVSPGYSNIKRLQRKGREGNHPRRLRSNQEGTGEGEGKKQEWGALDAK